MPVTHEASTDTLCQEIYAQLKTHKPGRVTAGRSTAGFGFR
jgi:hypothetical protein